MSAFNTVDFITGVAFNSTVLTKTLLALAINWLSSNAIFLTLAALMLLHMPFVLFNRAYFTANLTSLDCTFMDIDSTLLKFASAETTFSWLFRTGSNMGTHFLPLHLGSTKLALDWVVWALFKMRFLCNFANLLKAKLTLYDILAGLDMLFEISLGALVQAVIAGGILRTINNCKVSHAKYFMRLGSKPE